jgi:hypothetical protein
VQRGVVAAVLLLSACGDDRPEASSAAFDAVVDSSMQGRWRSTGDDTVEVWVCHVHPFSPAPIYGGLPLRAPLAAPTLTLTFQQAVTRYFHTISHGAYQPVFVAGGEIVMGIADDENDCVDTAIAGAAPTTAAVIAVADAEHAPGHPGGKGSGGDPAAPEGPVSATRRYAYVGAADFDRGTWGDAPPMDLVEHELGHTLGWVHSGLAADGAYLSGVDLMSNSAAPRDIDPSRRDGSDVLAIHRVLAGWLPMSDVRVADPDGASIVLAASTDSAGTRLLVLPVDDRTFLTVERREPDGYDDHLPHAGIAVHRMVEDEGAISSIDPLFGDPPFIELMQPADSLTADGWTITIAQDGGVQAVPGP